MARLKWTVCLLIFGAVSGAAPRAFAADPGAEEETFDVRVYMDVEEEAQGLLRAAGRARSAEPPNWRVVIEKYLEVNSRFGHTVYASNDRLYLPVREEVRRELNELPREAKEFYRALKGREAELAVSRALASGSFEDLAAVPDLYPCLDGAAQALYTLGEWCHAHGDETRAQIYWQQLLAEYPDWSGAGASAMAARAALAAAETGRRAVAERALETLRKTGALTKVRVAGRETLAAEEVEARMKAATESGPAEGGQEWCSIGGGAAHDGHMTGSADAGIRRWFVTLGPQMSEAQRRNLANQGIPYQQPGMQAALRQPVCASGLVFLAGDQDIAAYRARTGQLMWMASRRGKVDQALPCSGMTMLAVGQDQVYAVLGQAIRVDPRFGGQPQQSQSNGPVLHAYSLSGGKLKWKSGGDAESGKTREFLRDVDLISLPVYSGGYVYCPAMKRGSVTDSYMLCFDASNGRLVWKTFVCAGQPLRANYYGQQMPGSDPEDCQPPAVSGGVVAFVTNLGAVAALDAFSGRTRWIYLYDRVEPDIPDPRRGNRRTPVGTWRPSAPVISGGVLLAAPQDSLDLMALGLSDAEVRWKSRRGKLSRFLGVEGDRLACTGDREAVWFSVSSGKRLARAALPQQDLGMGLMGAGCAVVPTAAGIQRADAETGKVSTVCRFKGDDAQAGNLAVCGDVLVCSGPGGVGGYYSWDDIVTKLEASIAQTPDVAGLRAELAEVYFSGDRYAEAAGFYKEALERAKPGERYEGIELVPNVRRQVWECHSRLGAALEGEGRHADALEQYRLAHDYAQSDAEKMLGHMRFARELEAVGKPGEAVAEYQTVVDSFWSQMHEEGGRSVKAGAFAKSQIDRLVAKHGGELYASFETQAAEILKQAQEQRSIELAESLVGKYPNSRVVSPALILLSELLTEAGRHAEAAAKLREHAAKCPGDGRSVEARARLVLSYRRQGMSFLADSMMRRMLKAQPDAVFRIGDREWKVSEFVTAHLSTPGPVAGGGRLDLTPPLTEAWQASLGGGNPNPNFILHPAAVVEPSQEPSGLVLMRGQLGECQAVDLRTGKVLWRVQPPKGQNPQMMMAGLAATGAGAVITAGADGVLRALSLRTGETVWEMNVYSLLFGEEGGEVAPQNVWQQRGMQTAQGGLAAAEGLVVTAASRQDLEAAQRGRAGFVTRLAVLDEATGALVWATEEEENANPGAQRILFREGIVFRVVQAGRQGRLDAYDAFDGRKRFSSQLPAGGVSDMRLTAHGLLLLDNQTLRCFDTESGKLRWNTRLDSQQAFLSAVDDSRVILSMVRADRGRMGCQVAAYTLDTGKKLWSSTPVAGNFSQQGTTPLDTTNQAYLSCLDAGTRRGVLLAYDGETGKLCWKAQFSAGASTSSIVAGKKHVAALIQFGQGGTLCVWETDSGKLVHKAEVGPGFIANHEGALLLFSRDRKGKVTRLEPAGAAGGGEAPGGDRRGGGVR